MSKLQKSSEAEQISSAAEEQAKGADMAQIGFLANVVHEIRTPMNAIHGMSEFIIRDTTDAIAREHAVMIRNASLSLLTIVNDILDFSKLEAGRMELVNLPFQPAALIRDVLAIINVRLQGKNVRLALEAAEDIPSVIMGDAIRIKQVMINLLNNAVKFTEQGTVTLRLSCEKMADGRRIKLCGSVEDTGIGIRQEELGRLFARFARADMKKNHAVEGTGLGLAISRSLCEAMGGSIAVDSVYGRGSAFSWTTVNEVQDWRPMGKISRSAVTGQEKLFQYTFVAKNARVLVVDDNRVNLMVAEGMLAPYRMEVCTAESAVAAIELLRGSRFDLIFMDHLMPVMDGVEALGRLRRLPGRQDSVVIALTANTAGGMREKFLADGFQDFLPKPLEAEALDACLRKFIAPDKIVLLDKPSSACADKADEEVLRQFYRDGRRKIRLLGELAESRDWKRYTVEVHALKSAAALIGRQELSAMAGAHEQAGRQADDAYIIRHVDRLIAAYSGAVAQLGGRFAEELLPTPQHSRTEAVSEASEQEIKEITGGLKKALADYDLEEFGRLLARLSGTRQAEAQRELLEKMRSAAGEFDYDALKDLLSRWR